MPDRLNVQLTIGGIGVDGEGVRPVIDPATGESFALAPDCSRHQLDEAVHAANAAFPAWRDTPVTQRQDMLRAAADALQAASPELAALFTREQGRPLDGARQEIMGAAAWLRAFAAMAPPLHVERTDTRWIETRHVPLGVVAAIAPWNFPVMLSMWKVAAALVAGNCVVLKPSPFTPLCVLTIGALFRPIFPAGVLNVVSGGDELGAWMTAHPGFAKISFTGSTQTGRRIMAAASTDLKRITLELGGNDGAIVLPDADLDVVATKIFWAAFANCAQLCVAIKRLYVHEAIYDDLRDRLVALARSTRVGRGDDPGVQLGPIQNSRQHARLVAMLDQARADGLSLHQGAEVPKTGYFIPVTIVDNPPEDSPVVQEEAFGPILPMLRFSDVDEVVARVNASPFGLAGSVWTADTDLGIAIARRLETGTIWINHALELRPGTPFAGRKQSGFGVENGMEGLLEFTTPQVVNLAL